MITVIGKLKDTEQYVGIDGFNVLSRSSDWTPELNKQFIDEAIQRGDHLLFASWNSSGRYREELLQIISIIIGTPLSPDVRAGRSGTGIPECSERRE